MPPALKTSRAAPNGSHPYARLGKDYNRSGQGPYWGMWTGRWKNKPINAGYESNAMTVGTTGSGKSVGMVYTNGLAITDAKCFTDFKGSITCVLAPALAARGEVNRILNFADVYTDILGPTRSIQSFVHHQFLFLSAQEGFYKLKEKLEELAHKIYPEPESTGGSTDNKYFRDGSRTLIKFAILLSVLIDGKNATLGDALKLVNDVDLLLRYAKWAAGRLPVTPEIPIMPEPTAPGSDAIH